MAHQAHNSIYSSIASSILSVVSLALFLFVFVNIIVTTVFSNAIPSQDYYLDNSQLRFIVIVGFGLIFLGYKLNSQLVGKTLKLSHEEKIVLFVSAYFCGLFLFPNLNINFLLKNGLVIVFTPFLYTFFKKAVVFLIYPDFNIFSKAMIDSAIPKEKRFLVSIYTLAIVLVVVFLSWRFLSFIKKTNQIKSQFYITGIYPNKTTVAEDVTIEGYHFEWNSNNKSRISTQYGDIAITNWIDNKVIFNVPLNLKPGVINLYLQKPIDGKLVKSNVASFVLVPREEFFATSQDEFMDKVIKKLRRFYYLELWPLNRL